MTKTLYLMRHGQTVFNARRKIQGWCDSPLTELGIAQALKAKEYFSKEGITFDEAYSSTSERASDTLELITDMKYTRVKGLKEWNFGTFEGESEDLNPKLPYEGFFVPFGGEHQQEVLERVATTVKERMNQEGHTSVLMVSHGASCKSFQRAWDHTTTISSKERLGNCAILKFTYEDDIFTLQEVINPNL